MSILTALGLLVGSMSCVSKSSSWSLPGTEAPGEVLSHIVEVIADGVGDLVCVCSVIWSPVCYISNICACAGNLDFFV